MRSSDWSSDVCSSDLDLVRGAGEPAQAPGGEQRLLHVELEQQQLQKVPLPPQDVRCLRQTHGHGCTSSGLAAPIGSAIRGLDRKSVVEGKSVSVRVDLGGRRIIKKTNTNISNT